MGKPQQLRPDHPGKGGPKQANTHKGKPAEIDNEDTNVADDQDVAWYEYGAAAVAVGEDTLTEVATTGDISDKGPVTIATITVEATAAAEGGFTWALADTYVYSNADISILKVKEGSLDEDGVSYVSSYATYKSIHLPAHVNLPGGPKNKVIVIDHDEDLDLDIELDGNVATVTFDVEVSGDDTLATVDAYALAIEHRLSESAVLIEAAVG